MQLPAELYVPWTGINLWVPRIQYAAAICIFTAIWAKTDHTALPLVIAALVAAVAFETYLFKYKQSRKIAFVEGVTRTARVVDTQITRRGGVKKLTVEYQMDGKAVQSEQAVSSRVYNRHAVAAQLLVRVHPTKHDCWTPTQTTSL